MQNENKRSTCYQSITVSVDVATSDTAAAAQIHHCWKFLVREPRENAHFSIGELTHEHGAESSQGFWKAAEAQQVPQESPRFPLGLTAPPQQPWQEPSREMLVVLAPLLVDNCPPHTWLSLGWGEVMNRPTKWTQASLPREATFDQCWATYAGLSRGARRQLRKKRALL